MLSEEQIRKLIAMQDRVIALPCKTPLAPGLPCFGCMENVNAATHMKNALLMVLE